MTTVDPLLLQFAIDRPGEVAEVLSEHDSSDAIKFLTGLPARSATGVMAKMASRSLGRLLEALAPDALGEMLIEANHTDALTLVAHLHEHSYARILESVEQRNRAPLKRLFDQPQLSLAALASPDFIRVPMNATCESVAEELTASQSDTEVPIFIVDDRDRYAGLVNTQTVISKKNRQREVSALLNRIEPLPADMKASSALNAKQWLAAGALPVVDHDRHIVGAVTLRQLDQLVSTSSDVQRQGFEVVFSELATSYLELCASVASLAFRGPQDRTGEK